MYNVLAISIGAVFGAVLRYGIFLYFDEKNLNFPYHTLIVNIIGCFMVGLISEYLSLKQDLPHIIRLFLIVGFLGSFTTFSSFAIDSGFLIEKDEFFNAFIYIATSVVLGLLSFFVATYVIRVLFK